MIRERILILTAGFALDLLLGDPAGYPHPVRLIGAGISRSEKLCRRLFPAGRRGELAGGALTVLMITGLTTAFPLILCRMVGKLSHSLCILLQVLLCWQMLAARSLCTESMKVFYAASAGRIEEARQAVSMIVGRDTEALREEGILKAAVETVAENSSDGEVAPLFFAILFGIPGLWFYKAVNTMDSMLGYHNARYEYFGRTAARLDDLCNFLPSRICGLLLVLAAFLLPGCDGKNALRIFLRDRKKHQSPNSAQTEAACAGALGLQLAGDATYGGILHKKPYIGDPLRRIRPEDIPAACRLMLTASVLMLSAGCAFLLLAERSFPWLII